jgi:hypothetical protein
VNMIQLNPQLAKFEPMEVLPSLLSDSADKPELRRTVSDQQQRRSSDVEQLNLARLSRQDGSRWGSALEDADDFVQRSTYTFVPEDPRAYYRRLVEIVLKAQRRDDFLGLMSDDAREVLNECAFRWRVHPASRSALLLDVVKTMYDDEELEVEEIRQAFQIASDVDHYTFPAADVYSLVASLMTERATQLRLGGYQQNLTPRLV